METSTPPLHCCRLLHRVPYNRIFAFLYAVATLSLLYRHALSIFLHSSTFFSLFISISMFVSDVVLAFMWSTTQSFRMRPVAREEYVKNLKKFVDKSEFPGLDIFICTADPYKEPPVNVINTALSVMAYDYPTEKISVYVSDDGGSELTLFAFMEAAKFGKYWLPFCRENKVVERCPDALFRSNYRTSSDTEKIKMMYESMKIRVEKVVEIGKVPGEYITPVEEIQAFSKWKEGFTRHDHPTVIQVLLESGEDKDMGGRWMPNMIYVCREKRKASPHHFKAGALNALLRVSAIMTNAPIILTLDCDMYSNDPITVQRALCYLIDNSIQSKLGWVQFPQLFHGLNDVDIYACEHKRLFQINPPGMDGLAGASHVGTGCFFRRRVFFGGPSSLLLPEIQELGPDHRVNNLVKDQASLDLASYVAGCNYETHTNWGFKIGFRYGSLVEDYNTGYRLHCEGWRSIFCNPEKPAFLGDVPISVKDVLNQNKRWAVGLLEVAFSKFSPITYGAKAMGPLMALCYGHYAFSSIWTIPITIYAFIPQLALLNGFTIFPKVSNPWFFIYVFLFVGAYGQDCLDFILAKGTFKRWWSDQRMWIIRGLSSYLFGSIEFLVKHLGISTQGFNVTSKVVDDGESKRYDQGVFEFGVSSPMFLLLTTAAIINLVALLGGVFQVFGGGNVDELFVQMFIAGFGVLNCLPFYDAMLLRNDKGRLPRRTIVFSTLLSLCLYVTFTSILQVSK